MSTIVVGLDASPEAQAALDWARTYALPDDRILAVRAYQLDWIGIAPVMVPVIPADVELAAREALERLVGEAGDARIAVAVREGRPGEVLVAEAAHADLVVVGHRGDSRVSMMLGSTANYVLHHSPVPTVVVRGEFDGIRSVVVGVDDHGLDDGAENASVRALRWAYGVPGVETIRVVHAWHVPPMAIGVYPALAADFEALDDAALTTIERVMAAAGPVPGNVTVTPAAVRGTPGWAMVSESEQADLVVVGSRGVGTLRGLLLGSTSAELAAHAHAPICVIR